jgi:hypothetical protein
MPLLGSRRRTKPPPALTASGERIDLLDRTLPERIRRQRGPWQAQAWNYRELIGELGGGIEAEANVISKVQFIIGQVTDEDEPLPVTSEDSDLPDRIKNAAQEALEALPFRNGYAFQGVMSVCLRVAGECWLHGRTRDDREEWRVLSSDEVQPWNNGLGIIELPGMPAVEVGKDEVLLRLWKPHPRWKQLADSPMRRLLDTCEDIVLIGREIRAASRSRIAANGILLIPLGMSIVRKPDGTADDFQSQLEAVMLAPIGNEGDAGAVVPIVLQGDPEDLEKVRHLTLQREDSEELINKLEAALRRLREGMDMPPETGTGVGDMNHWSAWLMDSTRFKNYIEPQVRLMADSLTEAYLRPSLMLPADSGGWGLTRDEADQVQVWYDAGNVTENANRGTDAKDAYDRGELSGAVLRTSLGFNEDDAPDDEELRRMFAWKLGADPQTAARLLLSVLGPDSGIQVIQPQTGPVTIEQPPGESTPRTGGPGEAPHTPLPSASPSGVRVASGAPGARVVTGAELAEIERSLRERLAVACDMALVRVLERAGAKVRAAAQHTPLAAELKGLEPLAVCPLVVERVGDGPVALMELGLTEDALLGKAFADLREKFVRWTTDAVKATVRTLASTLDLPLTAVSALAQTMTGRIDTAWKGLEHRLKIRSLRKLYGMAEDELRGEVPDSMVLPGEIRAALAEIGGLPPGGVNEDGTPTRPGEVLGGLATGRDVMALAGEQADLLGFVWKYGVTPRGRQFEPHRRLEGERLAGWDDHRLVPAAEMSWVGPHYAPGDHTGCMCDYVPAWAVPEHREVIADIAMDEAPAMRSIRLLAELDDAAGRRTGAQTTRDQRDRIVALQQGWLERTR